MNVLQLFPNRYKIGDKVKFNVVFDGINITLTGEIKDIVDRIYLIDAATIIKYPIEEAGIIDYDN